MKKIIQAVSLCTIVVLCSCNNDTTKKVDQTTTSDTAALTATDSARVSGTPCNITMSGVHFTKSINGADTSVTTSKDGKIAFSVGEKKDFFCDPNNELSNNTAPVLLAKVDNTKPFTLTAKVTPQFTAKGLYNAGVLYLYVHDHFWQKFCFEQDERGKHRMVSVRTIGTSDDNNHDVVQSPWVYMKISSDGRTVASYYSLDKKNWNLVRLYKNNYPATLWAGISAQCPVDTGSMSYFEDVQFNQQAVSDFRMGN